MLIAQERASLVIANNMREARIEIKSVAERDDCPILRQNDLAE